MGYSVRLKLTKNGSLALLTKHCNTGDIHLFSIKFITLFIAAEKNTRLA